MRFLLTSGLVLAFSMAQAWGQNTTCTDPDACNYNANESGPCLYYTASDVTACAGDETTLEVTNLSVDPAGAPSSVIQAGNVSHAPFFVEDAEGALYVAAAFEGSHTVFGQTLTSTGEDDMYLAKLNTEGDLMWLIQGLADRDVNVGDLALMPDGGVTVVGTHLAAASWFGENGTNYSAGFTSSYNSGHRDGYSIRVNSEGEIVWGLTLTGGSNEGLNGVVSDSEGNAIITGGFNGCCPSYFIAYLNGEENEVTVESFGINYGTGVLTKISPQGEVLWTNTCHNRDVGLRPVGTDADGNVYLSSNFRSWNNGTGMIHIDATGTQHTVSNPGIGRAFLLQVDGNGIWQWGRSFGNLGSGPSAAIYVADMDVVDNDVRVVGSYFAGEVDFEGGDVVLPSSSHYRGYAAVYDLTGDLVQAADFDLSDGGFNASAMGTAGGQDWLAGSFESGSNAPANEGGRDALWCSIDWSDLSLGEPETFGGPDSDEISYLGEEQGRLAVGGFVTGSATSDNLQGEGGGLIYALGSEPLDVVVTWEDGTEGAVLPWTASETESVSFNVVAGNAICEGSILVSVPENECADSEACNFNPEHSCSSACVFPLIENDCDAGAVACAAGTVWDAESQTCVVATPAYLNEPGELAILNPCYFDSNANGLVEVTDLMNVLSVFGLACGEIPEAAEFSCGDPVGYQGYDYETVQIGEQCWFAENLRSERYSNDTDIPTDLDDAEWISTSTGARTIYGEGTVCDDFSPDFDACDPFPSLNQYGYLYNWFAIDNPAAICPQGWHVPSKLEWEQVISFLGGPEVAGPKMRSVSGFETNDGSNLSGFGGLPGGLRAVVDGSYDGGGRYGNWWSSTPSGSSHAWYLNLTGGDNAGLFFGDNYQKQLGHSVRCIKD